MRKTFAVALVLAGAFVANNVLAGQGAVAEGVGAVEVAPLAPGESYGTASLTAATASPFDCDTFSQGDAWMPVSGTGNRFLTSGFFECPIHVPSGALITTIELEACDTNASSQVAALFLRMEGSGSGGIAIASAVTGVAAVGGCARYPLVLPTPITVDNQGQKYVFQVQTGNTDTTAFGGVRVFYRLQVSPAPASATFGDVPTSSPFFRFIEALVASGVTGGCGGGNYCPDQPVTRGQMAVFLSTALGLHFTP